MTKSNKKVRIEFRTDENNASKLDVLVKESGKKTRSEVIRYLIEKEHENFMVDQKL